MAGGLCVSALCSVFEHLAIFKIRQPADIILIMKSACVSVGDGRLGYSDEAPYDAIHVGAAAPVVPQAVSLSVHLNINVTLTFETRNDLNLGSLPAPGSVEARRPTHSARRPSRRKPDA